MTVKEIIARRSNVADEARALVNKAEAEKRDLTAPENDKFNALLREAEDLATRAQGLGKLEGLESELRAKPEPLRTMAAGTTAPAVWRTESGAELRAFKHNERMTADGDAPGIGHIVRGIATGHWDGIDKRSVNLINSTGGNYFLPSFVSDTFIDLARAATVVSAAGATTVQLPEGVRDVRLVKATTDPTPNWVVEATAYTSTDPVFGALNLSLKKLGILVTVSKEQLRFAANSAQALTDMLLRSAAVEIDRAALLGDGATEPRGILNVSGIGTAAVTGSLDYDDVLVGIREIREANHEPTAAVWSPGIQHRFESLKDGQGLYLTPPAGYASLSKLYTTSMADTSLIIGDFSKLLLGVAAGNMMEISVSDAVGFRSDLIDVKLTCYLDTGCTHPLAFHSTTGITLP